MLSRGKVGPNKRGRIPVPVCCSALYYPSGMQFVLGSCSTLWFYAHYWSSPNDEICSAQVFKTSRYPPQILLKLQPGTEAGLCFISESEDPRTIAENEVNMRPQPDLTQSVSTTSHSAFLPCVIHVRDLNVRALQMPKCMRIFFGLKLKGTWMLPKIT